MQIQELDLPGYNIDTEISRQEFMERIEEMHETDLSLADFQRKNEPSYRDDRARKSLHLKDLSDLDREEKYIAELERFNPEHHPVLHLLVDFPIWLFRNRL